MVQNPSTGNEVQRPDSQELLEIGSIREEVGLAYEPINTSINDELREEVGQSVLDAAKQPSYLDQLAAAAETETMTPEQKLVLMGMNIQAMRRNAIKEGAINSAPVNFSKSIGQAKSDYAEAA